MKRSRPNAMSLSLMGLRSLLRLFSVSNRLIFLARHPYTMKKYGKLPRDGDNRPLLRGFATSLCQLQPEPTKLGVGTEWAEDILSCAHQISSQKRIARLRDSKLRRIVAGLPRTGTQPEIGTDCSALRKPARIFQREYKPK